MAEPLPTHESIGTADGSTVPSDPETTTSPVPDNAAMPDLGTLAGLFSLLGSWDSASAAGQHHESAAPAETPRHSEAAGAAVLLSALRPYLRDTRVLSVDRAIHLLETARGIRGLLHSFGPLLGDITGGKNDV